MVTQRIQWILEHGLPKKMQPSSVLVLVAMIVAAGDRSGVSMSHSMLMEITNLSVDTVRNAIIRLEYLGIIRVERVSSHRNTYHLLFPSDSSS